MKAIDALIHFREMLESIQDNKEVVQPELPICLEFVSHSFNDEVTARRGALLAIMSVGAGFWPLTLTCTMIDFSQSVKDPNDINLLPTLISDAIGVISDIKALEYFPKLVNSNNWYALLTNLDKFFYTSDETWVEDLKITVFTEDYVIIGKQKLDKDCNIIVDKPVIEIHSKVDYAVDADGNVGWKNEDGAYIQSVDHVGIGDESSVIQIKNKKSILDYVPNQ